MPLWVTFALIGAVITAVVGVLDKMVLSKWMGDPVGSFFVFGVTEGAFGLAAFFAFGMPTLPVLSALAAMAGGGCFGLSAYFYFRALKVGEVSRLIPLYALSPLLIAVFAAIFLGEIFPPIKYLGVALLIVGSLLVSLENFHSFRLGKGTLWMLASVGIIGVGAVISKSLLAHADPWTIFAYGKFGSALSVMPFIGRGAAAFIASAKRQGRQLVAAMFLSEALTSLTTIFFLYASASSYVTLVSAIIATNPFFLLVFTTLLSLYRPKILKEEFAGNLLVRKVAALILMFVGAGLVSR